jgi:hypothetical protein
MESIHPALRDAATTTANRSVVRSRSHGHDFRLAQAGSDRTIFDAGRRRECVDLMQDWQGVS